jgi:hypothetical protein
MVDVSRQSPAREISGAAEALDELERVISPTGYAKGRLRALRQCKLAPGDQVRADSLARRWGIG